MMGFTPLRTVRGRLVLAALAIELLMLGILVGNSIRLLREAMGEQAREQAEQIAPILSAALVAPLAQYDYATVQAVLNESHAIRGIDYVAVKDASGAIVATSGWPGNKPLPATDPRFSLDDDDDPPRYDLALPISLAGQTLGTLQFGLDLTRIQTARQSLLRQGVVIAAGELLLSAALLTMLGLLITRQLSVLTAASLKVARGQLTPAPVPEGSDDVGRLGAAFNLMSRAIAERVEQLTRATQETSRVAAILQDKNEQLEHSHVALSAENSMRLQAQRELEVALGNIRDRTAQLNAIFDLSPDGFVSFDLYGCVSYASPGFFRMTGLDANAVIGLHEAELAASLASLCVDPASFPRLADIKAGLAEVAQAQHARHLLELAGPGQRVLEFGLRLSDVGTVSQILIFRDVTHETEVERLKTEFLSHAAHELRTPMASIYGFSEMLLKKEFSEADRKEVQGIIHRQSEVMVAIINELLDLVRIDDQRGKDFQLEDVDVRELAREVVSDFGVPAAQMPLALSFPEDACRVRGDRMKLMRALRNILSNAYKYSPGGGEVALAVIDAGGTVDVPGRIGIRVSDHGIGMTAEQVARMFERFYRADDSGSIPGTGLGMSIVKEIIELHGGNVEVTSDLGRGTTVTLWLPKTAAAVGSGG